MSKDDKEKVPFPYNPLKDVAPVDQVGFIDLREAYVNNTVPGNLVSGKEDFNGVEDPSSLLGKSSDVFESYRKAQYVKSAEARAAAEAAAASSAAAE